MSAATGAAAAPLKVLIVEDNGLIAMHLAAIVRSAGQVPVGCASDASRALAMARASRPDLALVDLNLRDGLTGPEIMLELTREHGLAGVFVTSEPQRLGADHAGALGVVTKPFAEGAMLAALRHVEDRLRRGPAAAGAPPRGLRLVAP